MIIGMPISFTVLKLLTFSITFYQPKPRIDYTLKAVGGSLTALPGISDMIDVSSILRTCAFYLLLILT